MGMACELGECDHIEICYPDPNREYRGWCPYCRRPVYGDQPHTREQRTNGVTTQTVPVHDQCNPDITCCICLQPLGAGEQGAHGACIDTEDAKFKPCSRCGDDPNYCVCTTGWDSVRGMIW